MWKLLKYIVHVMDHMKDGRDFINEREYEKYVQDLTKGIEMLNLLLNANLDHKAKTESQGGRLNNFFIQITNMMNQIRESLKEVQVFIPNEMKEKNVNTFYNYDFSFPVFDKNFKPILPEFVDSKENKDNIVNVK